MKSIVTRRANDIQTFDPMRRKLLAAGSCAFAATGLIISEHVAAQDYGIEGMEARHHGS